MRKLALGAVFGQIKAVRGLRGMEKVAAEWRIMCLIHNLLRLFRAGLRPQTA